MTDENTPKPSGKNFLAFFSTLPGIITALATFITATGGFLIILNKTGCINPAPNHTLNIQSADTVLNDSSLRDTANVSYAPSEVKHITRYLTYKIKEAHVETMPDQHVVLMLKIKCVNDSKYEYNFYAKYIRVKIGEDAYPPDPYSRSDGYAAIPANGFTDLEYNYKLPAGTKNFSLVFYDENEEIGASSFTLK